jgi:hypothetical protein
MDPGSMYAAQVIPGLISCTSYTYAYRPPSISEAAGQSNGTPLPIGDNPPKRRRQTGLSADGLVRTAHKHFTTYDDAQLIEVMRDYGDEPDDDEWREIIRRLGGGFTIRQVSSRWANFLRPGLCREPFGIEEKRQLLKLAVQHFGKWHTIAELNSKVKRRSAAQISRVVVGMFARLNHIGITLWRPDSVDALPDRFFVRGGPHGGGEMQQEYTEKLTKLTLSRVLLYDVK